MRDAAGKKGFLPGVPSAEPLGGDRSEPNNNRSLIWLQDHRAVQGNRRRGSGRSGDLASEPAGPPMNDGHASAHTRERKRKAYIRPRGGASLYDYSPGVAQGITQPSLSQIIHRSVSLVSGCAAYWFRDGNTGRGPMVIEDGNQPCGHRHWFGYGTPSRMPFYFLRLRPLCCAFWLSPDGIVCVSRR